MDLALYLAMPKLYQVHFNVEGNTDTLIQTYDAKTFQSFL